MWSTQLQIIWQCLYSLFPFIKHRHSTKTKRVQLISWLVKFDYRSTANEQSFQLVFTLHSGLLSDSKLFHFVHVSKADLEKGREVIIYHREIHRYKFLKINLHNCCVGTTRDMWSIFCRYTDVHQQLGWLRDLGHRPGFKSIFELHEL